MTLMSLLHCTLSKCSNSLGQQHSKGQLLSTCSISRPACGYLDSSRPAIECEKASERLHSVSCMLVGSPSVAVDKLQAFVSKKG